MAAANLMNVSSVGAKITTQTASSKNTQEDGIKAAEIFAGFMNQSAVTLNPSDEKNTSAFDVKSADVNSAAESYERYSYKGKRIDSVKETEFSEVSEKLEETEQEVLDAVSDEYGVSEEEIKNMLDEMGLSVLDLLNPENLVLFVMQLTGASAGEELLLDESFLQVMASMDSLAEGLANELNVDKNGLQELVSQMEAAGDETELPEIVSQVAESAVSEDASQILDETVQMQEESADVLMESLQIKEESVQESEKTPMTVEDESEMHAEKKPSLSDENTKMTETSERSVTDTQEKQLTFTNDQNGEDASKWNQNQNPNSNLEQVMTTQTEVNVNTAADTTQTQFTSYLSADTMEIMEQVVQQIRVNISAETTSMEMQLNPENLGKVYVNISSEKGVVNAQFHATNEIVKEALETQIAALRENLHQAGVKVDSVEVTIESHEFERNLEQNHQNQENTSESKEYSGTKRRNISLDSLDELSGLMTEDEMLAAQIMKDNGNSVDFTA